MKKRKFILLLSVLSFLLCSYGENITTHSNYPPSNDMTSLSGKDEIPIKITKVEFANGDLDGKIITSFGEELKASQMHLLIPKVYYECGKKKKITLTYKILDPTGKVLKHGSYRNNKWKFESNQKDKLTLYPGKNQSCVLKGWGYVVYSSKGIQYFNYRVGTYKFELYYDDQKIYETFITYHKTEAEIQMEKEYADKAYMEIKKIEFANKKDGEILVPYGSTLYASQMRFLHSKIHYDAKCAENKEVTLYYKIIKPDGSLKKRTSSPEGYTDSTKFTISPGRNKTIELNGWGYKTLSDYYPGTYRYELWYGENKIYETSVTFYKTEEEIQTEREYASRAYMDIKKIEFGNVDTNYKELSPFGTQLYASQMRYLGPKIHYDAKCAENKEVTLYYKIIKPDGSINKGTSSPEGYTANMTFTISPGQNKTLLRGGWGNSNGGTYQPGTYRYELWYQGNKIYDTPVTFYKTEEEIQMEREYASRAYMDIKKIEFANKKDGDTITPYGEKLYASQMRYLHPKIYYDAKCAENKEVTLYYKIIKPDGSINKGTSSPEGYTANMTFTISPGQNKTLLRGGWGNSNGGTYQPGTYRYELWYQGNKIYDTPVTFYKTEEEIQMEREYASRAYMDIKKIEFGNKKDGDILTPYGEKLYASQMRFLHPKIYYDAKCAENNEVTLYSKIIKPDGSLSKGTSSPNGYTTSMKFTISPGQNKTLLFMGWGSENGGIYQPGTHRYELWYEGNKIYETSVTFYKTEKEIQMEREYASWAYMDIKKIEFANKKDGDILTPYGEKLYASQMRFLHPKIYYDAKCAENNEVTLYSKIIKPDGSLSKGTSSPNGYTTSMKFTISPGQNKTLLFMGWGSENGGTYKPGTYRYELWYQGKKIYATSFTIYQDAGYQSGIHVASTSGQTSSPAFSQTKQQKIAPDLRNLTLADIFPDENFPMTWTTSVGGVTLNSTLYASGLLEMSGSVPCMLCNQTGICGVCAGLKGSVVFYDINYQVYQPCGGCGGTGECRNCQGTGMQTGQKQTYRIDPLQILFPGDGSATVEKNVQGSKTKISIPTKYKYEICTLCDGTGHMDGSVAGFGNSKWCEKCHKMMPDSHCHGCKLCPGCGGKGVRRWMVH